jgi:hypothetical protein
MKQRKEVTVTIESCVSLCDILDGLTPDGVIRKMEEFKEVYQDRKIKFDVQYYGHDGGVEIVLQETRLETDKEYDRRIKAEQKEEERLKAAMAKTDEKERKEYERLKKKFEKKS